MLDTMAEELMIDDLFISPGPGPSPCPSPGTSPGINPRINSGPSPDTTAPPVDVSSMSAEQRGVYNFQAMMRAFFPTAMRVRLQAG